MGKENFNYLLKNVLILANTFYDLKLIDKIKSYIKQIGWKVNFYNNKNFS